MMDLEAMRNRGRAKVERKPVKTFLTDEAQERLQRAAEYTGLFMYELVEALILEHIPAIEHAEVSNDD